jgi:hypothetical protein
MATIAVTTNLNEQIGDALRETDPTISINTSTRGLAYGTCTGYIAHSPDRLAILVTPDAGTPAYVIDFKPCYGPDIRPTWHGPLAVFPLRDVHGITDDPRAVALRAAKEIVCG